MEDLTGKQFGPYRVVAPLGEGGMAAVYRAYQASVDRFVALKVLPRYFATDPEFVGRFEQEAKLLAKLQHLHILAVHDFGEADGYTYIVMPFVDSGTLADLLQGEPLPLHRIQQVITQVAGALDHAHAKGIIHRDIKPSNILIDQDGNCLLTDFGIAKMVGESTAFTQTGGIIGTPTYMSPEQIRGEELDGRNDIYSLGVILYEMATGRAPFRAETPPAVFVKHLHDPLPPPHIYCPDIPQGVERVILKALSKERKDRFRTAGEMAIALAQGIAGEPASAPAVKPGSAPTALPPAALPPAPRRLDRTEVVPSPKKEKRPFPLWAMGLIGLLALAIIVVTAINLLGPGNDADDADDAGAGDNGATLVAGPAATELPAATSTLAPDPTETPVPPTATLLPTPTRMAAAEPTLPPDPWGEVIIPAGEPILIAFIGDLSGAASEIGKRQVEAFMMAIQDTEIVRDFPIEPLVRDGACSADQGAEAASAVSALPNLVGLVGHTCSVSCASGIPVYEENHLVSISGSCTMTDLTEANWWGLFNRVAVREDRITDEFILQMIQAPPFIEFAANFEERAGMPLVTEELGDLSPLVAYTYDATRILLEGIGLAAREDDQGNLIIGRQALAETVRSTPRYPGVTGMISFDERGDRVLTDAAEECGLCVGLVAGVGGIDDAGFNQGAWQGLQRARADLNVCVDFLESREPADYEENIAFFVQMGMDLIITVGFEQTEATALMAQRNPDLNFAILDVIFDPPIPNVQNVIFDVDEAAFLAGYLAAAWADLQDPNDPGVGYLAGMDIPPVMQFVVGYTAGLDYYNEQKNANVLLQGDVADTFTEPGVGLEMGNMLIDQGVDVLFAVAGPTGNGALAAARERGKWGIGVDLDQYVTLPRERGALITSVLKRTDNAVYAAVEAAVGGVFNGGETSVGTLANDGVGLAPFHDYENLIPGYLKEELAVIRQLIIDGAIDTGW